MPTTRLQKIILKKQYFSSALSSCCNNPVPQWQDMSSPADITATKPAPEKAEEGVGAQGEMQVEKPQEEKGTTLVPQPAKDLWHWVGGIGAAMRKAAITVTPAFIVNNSSNFLGASHVATEMLLFKSSMPNGKLIQNPQNPINWVVEPIKNIYTGLYHKSKARDFTFKELVSGNPVKNFRSLVMDTEAATDREFSRHKASGKDAKILSLGNAWQTRSTFAGLIVWSLSALFPEKKESDAEIERMATMRTLHPIQYVGERLKQAVWFPDWTSHKRQMIGLGYMAIGVCSMLGSWRNRRKLEPDKLLNAFDQKKFSEGVRQVYDFNPSYLATGALSFLASIPLLFALDENKAYSGFGMIMMGRLGFLPSSIRTKYKNKEDGRHSYLAGMGSFQVENAMQALIGGAEKLPDGTIVDHEDEKKRAITAAKAIKRERKAHHAGRLDADVETTAPHTTISHATVERAMPERVADVARVKEAAAV
jgi:hypothetical protein